MVKNGLLVEQLKLKPLYSSQRRNRIQPDPPGSREIDMTKFILVASGCCYLIVVLDWYAKELVG